MPTITQLPTAAAAIAADLIPISQDGTTRAIPVGELLSTTQPAITLASPSLLGRTSLGPGGPEQITVGTGLVLSGGVLSANNVVSTEFPNATTLTATTSLVVSDQGSPLLMPATLLRSLFSAGNNVTISPNGTISAAGGGSGSGLGSAIGRLSVISGVSAQDLVPISHGGLDCAVSYSNLIGGVTIDQGQSASAAADTDRFWVAQGSSVMASQSFAAVWNWISSKLPTFKNPVVEISSSINLDATIHNGRLLVCSQPVTLTPLAANMGSGFHCHILNASSGNVTLGSGFVTSTGATSLTSWQSASVFCATYSGGTVVFASIAGAGSTTVPGVPGQVTSLAASGTTQTTISLVWQPPASGAVPASYMIQYRVSGTSTWVMASGITGTAYQISGLQAATGYDITIQAIAAGGNGSASTVLTVVTAASTSLPALPTVTNLSATAASSSSVTLTWIAGGGAASSYTVQYRMTGTTTWTTISGVTGTTSLISGLTAATGYDFGIFGVNAAGNGQLSSIVTVTTQTAPHAVTSINWNLVPNGSYARGSGAIGVNAQVTPGSSAIQFGFSTSNTVPPSGWTQAILVNSNLWGAYVATPGSPGTWYVWAEGLDGSALTVNPTPFTVT